MALYKYVGRTRSGKLKRGTIEGMSRREVIAELREKGISPREVTETKPNIFNRDIQLGRKTVKIEHFVIYCRQFATLIRAGISIVDSTNILTEQSESKVLRETLKEVERDVRSGVAFSDAIEKHSKVFPALFVNMIRSGEMTGNLDDSLDRLATYYEKQHSLQKKIKSALAYPVILSILIVLVVIFLMVVIIPQFTAVYDSLGAELPSITKVLISISAFLQSSWWIILLIALAVAIAFVILYRKNEKFHYSTHVALLKLPIFGKLLQKAAIARMTKTLSSLFSSAVPILDGLEIAAKVGKDPVMSKVLMEARSSLEAGGSLSEPLRKHWVFPPLVHQMIAIGEQTGALDYMLEKIADFYEEDVDRSVETLQSLIEPIMIVALAVVVGFIVLAVMIPMFSVFTEIQ